MTGKEQFQRMKNQLPYISKDGRCYQFKFYDVENNCCRFMITESLKGRKIEDIPTYEEVKDEYNIELEDTIPTPDQYFLRKIDEPSNINVLRTVSDRGLISYVKYHKEECVDTIEKLKEIVRTYKKKKIRKAAYETLVAIGVDGLEELESYLNIPEDIEVEDKIIEPIVEVKNSKPNRTNPLNKEKAIIIYMSLVKKYKDHRERITCGVFLNEWKEMFKCDKYNVTKEKYQSIHDKQIAAFAYAKGEFDDKSYDEIKAIRDTFMIYPDREVPVELKQLAHSKGVVITLAENIDKHLSGFNVLVKEKSQHMSCKINDIPYGLSEKDAKKLLESLPAREDIVKSEKNLMTILMDDSIEMKNKKKAVSKYRVPYATNEFKKFMNRFTIYDCQNKELTLFCVNLCKRVGINNLSNELPIEYKFCVGSGKRKQSMKRAKSRKKANKKNKSRKGKK